MVRRRTFLKVAGSVGTVGTVGLAGCSGNGGGGGSGATIGYLAPLSGPGAFAGENGQNGVDIAVEEINSAGLLDGEISTNVQDTATEPQQAVSAYQTLVSQGVTAIIGASSFVISNLLSRIEDDEIPLITPFATTAGINDTGGQWLWRTQTNDSLIGVGLAEYALQQDYNSMALALEQERGTQSLATVTVNHFEENGGELVKEINLPANASDFRGEVQQIVDADPDIVYLGALEDVGSQFVQNYAEVGADIPLIVSDEITNQNFIDLFDGNEVEGILGVTLASGPSADAFAQKHTEEFDSSPGPFAASTYDAVNVTALATEQAGEAERSAVPDGLRAVGGPPGTEVTTFPEGKDALANDNDVNLVGAATPLNFNEFGDVLGPVAIQQVSDGEWSVAEVIPESDLQ